MPWYDLLYKTDKTDVERMLLKAVLMLSTQPAFSALTPEKIYGIIYTMGDTVSKEERNNFVKRCNGR